MKKISLVAGAVLATLSTLASAQVTIYGRIDLSLAQRADVADSGKELRNGSGSRFGVRGVEDLGDGFKAVFQLEQRFDADTGAVGNPFWGGKSIVGLEGKYGRITLGREENPAYTLSQVPADPWATDNVSGNGDIINGRIGTTRYSNTVNYSMAAGGFTFGAQMAERDADTRNGYSGSLDKRPYSLGLAYAAGPLSAGLGYENPADQDDEWFTVSGAYKLGVAKIGGLIGTGKNVSGQKHRSWLLSGTVPVTALGELRVSYGQLKNQDTGVVADKQFGLGYHYKLSKRTTVYADLVDERRDNMPANRKKTGYDLGIRHNF